MKLETRRKIQAALARADAADECPSPPVVSYDLEAVANQAIRDERSWTLREIAERHGLSYWTVYRQLKGKPGWLPFGRTIRVCDSLYRSWIGSIALKGINAA
jgi:hypothetical protein